MIGETKGRVDWSAAFEKVKAIRERLAAEVEERLEDCRIALDRLIKLETRDWHSVGRSRGLKSAGVDSLRDMIDQYFGHAAKVSTAVEESERKFWAKWLGSHEKRLSEEIWAEEESRRRLQADLNENNPSSAVGKLKKEIEECRDEMRRLKWEDPTAGLARSQREIKELHAGLLRRLNEESGAIVTALLQRVRTEIDTCQKAEHDFRERLALLERRLIEEEDENAREVLRSRLQALREDFAATAAMRRDVRTSIQDDLQIIEEIGARVRTAKENVATEMARDENVVSSAILGLKSRPVAKSPLYLGMLFIAILAAGSADVAIMNEYTGKILGLGTLYEAVVDIGAAKDVWHRLSAVMKLCFVGAFALLPFVLSFGTKMVLDLETEGVKWRRGIWLGIAASGFGYVASVAWSAAFGQGGEVPSGWVLGGSLLCISVSVILLGGWLLHHFFAEFENFRRIKREDEARTTALQENEERIATLELVMKSKRGELEGVERIIAQGKMTSEGEKSCIEGIVAMGGGESTAVAKAAAEAAKAALAGGYEEGAKIRAVGDEVEDLPLDGTSVEKLSERWQRAQLKRSILRLSEERGDAAT